MLIDSLQLRRYLILEGQYKLMVNVLLVHGYLEVAFDEDKVGVVLHLLRYLQRYLGELVEDFSEIEMLMEVFLLLDPDGPSVSLGFD